MEDSDLDDSAQEMDIGPIARAQVGTAGVCGSAGERGGCWCAWEGRRVPYGAAVLQAAVAVAGGFEGKCSLPAFPPPSCPHPQVRRALKSIAMKQQKLQLTAEAQAQRSSHSFS